MNLKYRKNRKEKNKKPEENIIGDRHSYRKPRKQGAEYEPGDTEIEIKKWKKDNRKMKNRTKPLNPKKNKRRKTNIGLVFWY